jgi:hypothetical protein
MRKSLLFVGLLTFSSLMFAGSKTYPVTISEPTKVGSAQLAKGTYTMHVEGDKAVFVNDHQKAVSVAVKLESGAGKKFEYTSVEAAQKDGAETIKLIHLGGSTTTLAFGD